MYKVFIVDDEYAIAKGLEKIIDWERLGCSTLSFTNSIRAYESALCERPDILITDIKMPHMDGLELIEKLKTAGVKAAVIILSGFTEFEYARKGIALGVNSYILKPVEQKEMESAILQAIQKFEEQNTIQKEHEKMKALYESGKMKLWDITFQDIVTSGQYGSAEILDITAGMELDFKDTPTLCAVVDIYCNPENPKYISTNILNSFFADVLQDFEIKQASFCYTHHQYGVILNSVKPVDASFCKELFRNLNEMLSKAYGIQSVIGIGGLEQKISGISESFQQALNALDYRIIQYEDAIIEYKEMETTAGSIVIPITVFNLLEESIDRNDFEGAKKEIDKAFDILLSDRSIKPLELQIQCLNILLASIKNLSYIQLQLHKTLGKDILSLRELSRFNTHERLKAWILNLIKIIIELKNQKKAVSDGYDLIENIKNYIDAHYTENISLPEIAEHFYLNSYYLSQLFKKKTGHTYISYLTNKRIKKARELLSDQNAKIYEVCHKVGYENVRHFSKTFERIVGVKPSSYKDDKNSQ